MESTTATKVDEDILVNLSDWGSHLDRITFSYSCFPDGRETSSQWSQFTAPKHNNLQRIAVTLMEGN